MRRTELTAPLPVRCAHDGAFVSYDACAIRLVTNEREAQLSLNPCVTAARVTPSARASSARLLYTPSSSIRRHRAHRSGPVSRRSPFSFTRPTRATGRYRVSNVQVPPFDKPGDQCLT